MEIIRTLILIFIVFIFGGSGEVKSDQCRKWKKTFFRMPTKEQIETFGGYNIETQYEIFICGNQKIHPPALYLAGPFASQGEKAVDFLKVKLYETKDDHTIRDVIVVFDMMCVLDTYDVANNSELMRLIKKKAGIIKDDDWRKIVEKIVNGIINEKSGTSYNAPVKKNRN
jgi:hypothetical protein